MSKKKKVEEEKVKEVLKEEKIEEAQEEMKEEKTKDEETLEEKMAKIEADLDDWKSAYARKNAEFQNFTKRKQKELEEFRKYASEKVILKVL